MNKHKRESKSIVCDWLGKPGPWGVAEVCLPTLKGM